MREFSSQSDRSVAEKITFGIVEDEILESEALTRRILQYFPQAQILWCKEDGASALEAIHQEQPDILIVDIEMPIMDGLELCRHLYEEQCSSVIIINTAYDKFSYAKRAISFHVFEYIVKPVLGEELRDTLEGCIAEVIRRRQREQVQNSAVNAVERISRYAVSVMADFMTENKNTLLYAAGWPKDKFQTRVLHVLPQTPFSAEQICSLENGKTILTEHNYIAVMEFVDDKHMVAVIQPQNKMTLHSEYTRIWCFAMMCSQKISGSAVQVSGICEEQEAIEKECKIFSGASGSTAPKPGLWIPPRTWQIIRRKDAEKNRNRIEAELRNGDFECVQKIIRKLMRTYEENKNDVFWEIAQYVLDAIMNIWSNADLSPFLSKLFEGNFDQSKWVREILAYCATLPKSVDGDSIENIIRIMQNSFMYGISQSQMAEHLGLDNATFSKLFKKRTGQNFSDMLNDIRMQHAEKLLLENSDISLENLCQSCGLTSKTYFCEVFKEWKGMTITQFLKNQTK